MIRLDNNGSIHMARALHCILVTQDIKNIGRYNVLSKGHLLGLKRREITAPLKNGGKIPFSYHMIH